MEPVQEDTAILHFYILFRKLQKGGEARRGGARQIGSKTSNLVWERIIEPIYLIIRIIF